jgi:hypothetical protein
LPQTKIEGISENCLKIRLAALFKVPAMNLQAVLKVPAKIILALIKNAPKQNYYRQFLTSANNYLSRPHYMQRFFFCLQN